MVRVPLAVLDDLRAAGHRRPLDGTAYTVYMPVDAGVPLRVLLRDALAELVHIRIVHNAKVAKMVPSAPVRTKAASELSSELQDLLKDSAG